MICISQDSNGVGGSNSIACPPLNDCISPGQICTDNTANVQEVEATRSAKLAEAQQRAQAAKDEAAAANADAQAAKNAKEAASQASQDAAQTAQQAAQQAGATDTTSPTAIQAAQAAAQAAQRQAADAIAAANAAAQAAIAAAQKAIADAAQGAQAQGIAGGQYGPNMADDRADQVETAAGKAKKAAWGAIAGVAPEGQPSAGEGGPGTMNCPDCAKEGTLQAIKTNVGQLIAGTPKQAAADGDGHFDMDALDQELETAKTNYRTAFNNIKSSMQSLFAFDQPEEGQLPIFEFGVIKGVPVIVDLNRWAEPLSYVGLALLFLAAFIAVYIFLGD